MKRPPTRSERGFALLIVFLMAAVVAFSLYRQLPRVAFESQRDKEELLMERGEQFKRAIQLFVVANKRYPAKIEDLENTNDKRYLRRRYIDPLTGKDEWRLIHVNAAGLLTDSLVQKPPPPGTNPANQLAGNPLGGSPLSGNQPGGNPPGANPLGGDLNPNGAATAQQPQPVNNAVLRRPSDRSLVQESGGFGGPGFNPAVEPGNDPSQWPAITLLPPAQAGGQAVPGQAGLQPGNPQFNPQPQFPGQFQPGQQQPGQPFTPGQQFPGQQFPGQPFTPGQPVQGQQPIDQQLGQFGQPFPGQAQQNVGQPGAFPPGLPGQLPGQPGFNPQFANQNNLGQNNPGQNNPIQNPVRIGPDGQFIPVTNLPGQVVNTQTGGVQPAQTQPQFPPGIGPGGAIPAGAPGSAPNTALDLINKLLTTPSQNVPAGVGNNNNTVAGGIAGVASTFQGPSIKVYKERQKYNEWEFVFDLKSTQPGANQQQNGQQSANQQQNGQQNQNQQTGGSSTFAPQNQNQGFSLGPSPGAPPPR